MHIQTRDLSLSQAVTHGRFWTFLKFSTTDANSYESIVLVGPDPRIHD